MPSGSPSAVRTEAAWARQLLCAAEIVDAVTLEPVTDRIIVRATGLSHAPFVNASGFHVWLEEGGAKPTRITVDASQTEYADADSAAPTPPQKSVRIELAPTYAYRFPPGATAFRGRLLESRYGTPKPVAGSTVRLQWSGDYGWTGAPTSVSSNANGDFAAPLRFSPNDKPTLADGKLTARLRVSRGGVTRTSDEFALARGFVSAAAQSFFWDDLNP